MTTNTDSMSHELLLPPLTDRTISVSGSAGSLVDGQSQHSRSAILTGFGLAGNEGIDKRKETTTNGSL